MPIQTRGPAKDLVSMTSIIPHTIIIITSIFAVSNNQSCSGWIYYSLLYVEINLISGQNDFNLG